MISEHRELLVGGKQRKRCVELPSERLPEISMGEEAQTGSRR